MVHLIYGLAISSIVIAGAFAVGDISGGSFNPAIFIGDAGIIFFAWGYIWLYFVAQFTVVAAAAAFLFNYVDGGG